MKPSVKTYICRIVVAVKGLTKDIATETSVHREDVVGVPVNAITCVASARFHQCLTHF